MTFNDAGDLGRGRHGVHGLGARIWANRNAFSPQVASRSAARRTITSRARIGASHRSTRATGRPPATGCTRRNGAIPCMEDMRARCVSTRVLGLFRLWWIPQDLAPAMAPTRCTTTKAMLGVLALAIEATRAGGMVIGEDLGTVPDYVRRILADHGVLGTDVGVDSTAWTAIRRTPAIPTARRRSTAAGTGIGHHTRCIAANRRLSG